MKSFDRKPLPAKSEVLQTRVTDAELLEIHRLAKKYAGGNVSAWVRFAALNFSPLTGRGSNAKLIKRK